MYDKMATNPFIENKRIVIVWIEDDIENDDERDISSLN